MFQEPVGQALFDYWNEVRGDRVAPRRFEVEPSRIATILPDTFILEKVDADTSRFRVAGTRLGDAFGLEFRGLNIFELFNEQDRITLKRQLSIISLKGAVGVFELLAETNSGLTARFSLTLMPLVHTRDVVDRFVGTIAKTQNLPWIGTVPLETLRLGATELVWPDGRQHAMIDGRDRQTPFAPPLREARIVRADRRQFRVYDGGLAAAEDE